MRSVGKLTYEIIPMSFIIAYSEGKNKGEKSYKCMMLCRQDEHFKEVAFVAHCNVQYFELFFIFAEAIGSSHKDEKSDAN